MSRRRASDKLSDKVELNMTPMIDVVFQLLAFFLLSMNIAQAEGDFQVKMPLAARAGPETGDLPPLKVRLAAGPKGELAGIFVNGRRLAGGTNAALAQLRAEAKSYAVDPAGQKIDAAEVEIDADANLNYQHVMDAITQVSGYRTPDGKMVKLIERIKFGKQPR